MREQRSLRNTQQRATRSGHCTSLPEFHPQPEGAPGCSALVLLQAKACPPAKREPRWSLRQWFTVTFLKWPLWGARGGGASGLWSPPLSERSCVTLREIFGLRGLQLFVTKENSCLGQNLIPRHVVRIDRVRCHLQACSKKLT